MGKAASRKQRGRVAPARSASVPAIIGTGAPWLAFEVAGRKAAASGDFDGAIDAFARAVAAGSTSPDVSNDLGALMACRGQLAAAVVHLETAVLRAPNHRDASRNLLTVLEELAAAAIREGRLPDAAVCFGRLAALDPRNGSFHARAGATWRAARRPMQALPYARRARALLPDDAAVCFGLGLVLLELDQKEAEVELERALTLRPDFPDALCNLALVRSRLGHIEDARRLLERAILLNPEHAEALGNLAGLLRQQGEIEASLVHYRRATELRPESPLLASSLLLTRQGDPAAGPIELVAEHRAWNDRFAAPLAGPREARDGRPFASRDRDPNRPLRVGYVSADLRSHSVASFIEPLVVAHDRGAVEVICYADGPADFVTARIRAAADEWHDTRGLSDDELAAKIEGDRVDVLVDLHGHTSGNRLLCFARRPAPVQVTYCGYPGTTGVAAIEWRLTDPIADPPGSADDAATERLWRLPSGFLCFLPNSAAGEVGPLPAAAEGQVTFGSFNNLAKLNEGVLRVWAQILDALPASRLFLKSRALGEPTPAAARLRAFFAAQGIDPARIAIAPYAATSTDHLALYRQVDIGLDPFPYNGTTTTCEALWMGVPVVTMTGQTHAGRVGASLLTRVGLPELVTDTPDAYVRQALSLARDLPALADLRASLRARVACSPLVSAPTVAREIEAAYRAMWRLFCAHPGP